MPEDATGRRAATLGMVVRPWGLSLLCVFAQWATSAELPREKVDLEVGGRIAIVGDGLATGIARSGYLETALHLAFPDRKLTIRSFAHQGFRVDETEAGMGSVGVDGEVAAFGPDLIFVCAGSNESFDGAERVADFGRALRARCEVWGRPRPGAMKRARIELIPPLPYVQSAPGLPDEPALTTRLTPYVQEMRAIAGEDSDVGCLDVTTAFASLAFELSGDVTRDGRQLNRRGHWLLAMLVVSGLELTSESVRSARGTELDPEPAERLRELVRRKEVDWEASGHQGGERGRGWDQALWSSHKPALAALWAVEPESMDVCPAPQRSLGMPMPSQFGMGARNNPVEAESGMRCSAEMNVSLWASESGFELWNPVTLRFDHEGRAWIGCAPPGREPCLVRLEDQDRDQRADRQVVAVAGAIHPEGFVPGWDGVYVSTGEGLAWYQDADGDGVADHHEVLLSGVAPRRGLRWGPDGGLWFTSDGASATTISRNMETPWGAVSEAGAGWVCWRPATGRIDRRVRSAAGREVFFDEWGEPLMAIGRDSMPMGLDRIGNWAGDVPLTESGEGVLTLGEAGPWALLQGEGWPKPWRGGFVRAERNGEAGWALWVYVPEWAGSMRRWRRQDAPMLTSDDPNFCPVAIEAGPDRALYLLDAYGREKRLRAGSFGRIWRLAGKRWPPSWAASGKGNDPVNLLQQLHRGDAGEGEGSRLALWQRPAGEVFTALGAYLQTVAENDPDRQKVLLEALRIHLAFGAQNPELLVRLTQSPDPGVRHASAYALGEWGAGHRDRAVLLQRLIEDENPRVRSAALCAARQIGGAQAGAIARLASHQRMDDDMKTLVDATVRQLGSGGTAPPSLLAKAKATSTEDLIAGEMTPHAANVLLERNGVENSVLKQAAAVLAGRAGMSIERWVVERLEDRSSPDELIGNLVRLIALAEGWELYQCSPSLRALVASADRPSLQKAAYAALAVGAAESGTLDALIGGVERAGDYEMAALLDGCGEVMAHLQLRSQLSPIVRAELSRPDTPALAGGVKVRLRAPGWDVLHFAELQVLSGGRHIARERPARQSESPNGKRWWGTLAKNGVNGVLHWEEELPLKDLVPGAEAIRGVKVAANGNSDPWWEVDLGAPQVVDRLVYHPGEEVPASRPLRFEVLDSEDRPIWAAVRYSRNEAPVELEIGMSAKRRQAAVRVARVLGEDFRRSLETVAKHSALLQDRFNALRALQLLGEEVSGLRMRMVAFQYGEEGFNKKEFIVAARDAVELTLRNTGKRELAAGIYESATGATAPVIPLGIVAAGEQVRFPFVAPSKPGIYFLRSMEATAEIAERLQIRLEIIPPPSAPKK